MSPAPKDPHQKIITSVLVALAQLIPDGELRVSPADVYFDGVNVLQPDIFWVSDDTPQ